MVVNAFLTLDFLINFIFLFFFPKAFSFNVVTVTGYFFFGFFSPSFAS